MHFVIALFRVQYYEKIILRDGNPFGIFQHRYVLGLLKRKKTGDVMVFFKF